VDDRCAVGAAAAPVTAFAELLACGDWAPIRGCPGRYVLRGGGAVAPAALVGADAPLARFTVAAARDPVLVAALAGGGLISYARPDGSWVHTLNTPAGFARKLAQLGIALPA
jgi:hypothetical protein